VGGRVGRVDCLRGGRVVGGGRVGSGLRVVWTAFLGSPGRMLHRSDVQMQARIVSDSTGSGEQVGTGSTGLSKLPSRILVGKHSRITAVSESPSVLQE
jgi:hypothetical protein